MVYRQKVNKKKRRKTPKLDNFFFSFFTVKDEIVKFSLKYIKYNFKHEEQKNWLKVE